MKRLLALPLLLAALAVGAVALAPSVESAAPVGGGDDPKENGIQVTEIRICRDVDRDTRTPLEEGAVFESGVERLYCFTRLAGAADTTHVTHLWLHEGRTRGKVPLDVRSPDWRTWSSKTILPSWTGAWEVRVLDRDGLVLGSTGFQVTKAQSVEERQ